MLCRFHGKNATDDGWKKTVKGAKGQIFFVSCRSDEYSVESPFIGAGFFTQALLKGLRGKLIRIITGR